MSENNEEKSPLEENILAALAAGNVASEVVSHEPVYTNPAMAEALGVEEAMTVKSLVLADKKGEMLVLVMPGNCKADWKRVAKAAGFKVSFAKPDQVAAKVGCEVGCVPPFGHLTPLPVYMDPAVLDQETMYFNPGVHHRSVKISTTDLKDLCAPTFI